jgi:hypothetical protein
MIKPKEMCATIEDWWKLKDHGCSSKCELMITSYFEGESRTHALPHSRKWCLASPVHVALLS